jgi:hypothetical protein
MEKVPGFHDDNICNTYHGVLARAAQGNKPASASVSTAL